MVQESLMGMNDAELNGKDLRCKYYVSDNKLMLRKQARERYMTAKLKQKQLNGNRNCNYGDYFGQDDYLISDSDRGHEDLEEGFELNFMAYLPLQRYQCVPGVLVIKQSECHEIYKKRDRQ